MVGTEKAKLATKGLTLSSRTSTVDEHSHQFRDTSFEDLPDVASARKVLRIYRTSQATTGDEKEWCTCSA